MSLKSENKITDLKGIGPKQANYFKRLNIESIRDLLFYIPYRYQDTSSVVCIEDFKNKKEGTFLAEIEDVKTTYFRKKITTVKVKDDTGSLRLTFFNQAYLQKALNKGDIYIFNAKITERNGRKNIFNPKLEKFKESPEDLTHLGKLVGIYAETKGLTSRTIRRKIKLLENSIDNIVLDPLSEYLQKYSLLDLPRSIQKIHFPENQEDLEIAKKRLSFDEMLHIAFKIEKQTLKRKKEKSSPMEIESKTLNKFIKNLQYKLTDDQNKCMEEILLDTSKKIPMNRLLNGDVGSGKTVVAAAAVLNTIRNGHSAILIAPTTVLAQQHFNTFTELFQNEDIAIELCTSSRKTTGKVNNKLLIGTHAIFYQKDLPSDLNLVVIDEQHRFGVEQREYFKKKDRLIPHYLTMTATPIPRSLTEIFFGGVEVSEIREKPKNRKDVKTYFTPFKKRDACFEWIKNNLSESRNQAFIIYPLIEESQKLSAKAVLSEFEYLKDVFKGLNIQFLHGRLKPKEKERLLEQFRAKDIDILVSTTVIEVGIDIPDATIIVIEDAERFGLAQLHQLRGRVGRSDKESFCFVIPSSSVEKDSLAEKRLIYFSLHNSGFEVAEYDLQSRGPGEVYGTRQSGIPNFKVASIHDISLLKQARSLARKILREKNDLEEIEKNLFR